MKPTDIRDQAAGLLVQQELSHLGPGLVAAVVEVGRDFVVNAVDVLPLQRAGRRLHDASVVSALTM